MLKTKTSLTTLAALGALILSAPAAAHPVGAYTTKGAWSFFSARGLHPPKLKLDSSSQRSKLAPGYIFLSNSANTANGALVVGQSGPLILDSHLQPVWFKPVPTNVLASNLELQSYNGAPALSWWQGDVNGLGVTTRGEYVVVDQHYHQIATLTGKNGWLLSLHEFVITGHDAWVTAYKTVSKDLSRYHGSKHGKLLDAAAQEYDLTSGKLLHSWDLVKHISLGSSQQPAPKSGVWDAYHLNSIQIIGSNEILISARNTWAAYLVNTSTGKIVWTLSGKPHTGNFTVAKNARFEWQHDVRMQGNLVSIFDDACCRAISTGVFANPNGSARGLILKLDLTHHTAKLDGQYTHGGNFFVAFLGNTELLPNGNVMVGWGSHPNSPFTEYTHSGHKLLDASFPKPDESYRALVEQWTGLPSTNPSGAVRTSKGKATVYASWNGATEVAKWRVLAGPNTSHLVASSTKGRSGFETAIKLTKSYKLYELQALNSSNVVIGTSVVFTK